MGENEEMNILTALSCIALGYVLMEAIKGALSLVNKDKKK